MTPIYQRILHNPPESYGDCHRAAVASLLDLSYEEVPHFMNGLGDDDKIEFDRREAKFLESRGLERITFAVIADSISHVWHATASWNPGKFYLLGVLSGNGHNHTVIGGPGGLAHDPNPFGGSIAGPMKDGCFWVTYIVGKLK